MKIVKKTTNYNKANTELSHALLVIVHQKLHLFGQNGHLMVFVQ